MYNTLYSIKYMPHMVYIRYTHTCITDFMPHIHGIHKICHSELILWEVPFDWRQSSVYMYSIKYMPHIYGIHKIYTYMYDRFYPTHSW